MPEPDRPEGWVEGELMPGPPPPKPKWYEDTSGPIPPERAADFEFVPSE